MALTEDEKQTILAQHNAARANYNLPPLVWDEAAATLAQGWADHLAAIGQLEHNPNRDIYKYGECCWGGPGGPWPINMAVESWVSESQWYDINTNTCNAPAGQSCGHFT